MRLFGLDSLNVKRTLVVDDKEYEYFDINIAAEKIKIDISKLPFSIKILLENLLRYEDGSSITVTDVKACANHKIGHEIAYNPARVLMQDFTGVPAAVDLASMREAVTLLGGDPQKINPLSPVDLVIDHSVQVDKYGSDGAFAENVSLEMERNMERYQFLRWAQQNFNNFRVVPPGTGICHQVNLEFLSQVVWTRENNGRLFAYPDTLVGTDSHTTMVNGLAVLGWGVGGIEAEAVMLGQSMSMLIPEVIGFKLIGALQEGATATDLVLTITEILRKKGVVNKFVEFYGNGLDNLKLADRATIANMAPEYGATCGFFPIDQECLNYLALSGRSNLIPLVESYAKTQGLWRDSGEPNLQFTDIIELDISTVEPSLAGPKRPQDRVILSNLSKEFINLIPNIAGPNKTIDKFAYVDNMDFKLANGDIVIAAITSCTNTSNPSVMMAAGLVAKKAVEKGLKIKPWVKTSLAPGSQVVSEYLKVSGLQLFLDKLGFNIVGYGCTTCIGNSGPLLAEIEDSISKNEIVAVSILSGNRNFEGRVHPLCKANYLASPPLVVAYAIAGSVNINLSTDPIGKSDVGEDIYLKDIWPTNKEISDLVNSVINAQMFKEKYSQVFKGDKNWQSIDVPSEKIYSWNKNSTYIANPPYFVSMSKVPSAIKNVTNARMLAKFGDSITTDHISPAGNISKTSPAAKYLIEHGVEYKDFNSYGARRGHHEVMMRGTFANIRIRNELAPGTEGGFTTCYLNNTIMSIYDASIEYQAKNIPLIVIAGKEYGTGSSRDWAAKGTMLLGVKIVIAESFERIHRSNLVRMGIIPLQFKDMMTRKDLNLQGDEIFDIIGLDSLKALSDVKCVIRSNNNDNIQEISLLCRIDTEDEVQYVKHGGILQYVIRQLNKDLL